MLYTRRYLFCALLTLSTAVHASHNPLQEKPAFETLQRFVKQSASFVQGSVQHIATHSAAFTQQTFRYVRQSPLPVTAFCLLLSIGTTESYHNYYPLRAIFKDMPSPYNTELCEGLALTREYATLLESWDALYAKQSTTLQEALNRYVRPKMCCISNLLSFNNPEDISVAYCNAQSFL